MTTFAIRAQPRPVSRSATLEYACREAIRLGEREARTAKQPQGHVHGEKEDVLRTGMQIKICPKNYQLSSANYQLT